MSEQEKSNDSGTTPHVDEEPQAGGERAAHGDPIAGEGGPADSGGQAGEARRDLSWHLERIWNELKDVTRQLESETRRGGRIARLRFDIRGLRQEMEAEEAKLGRLVYDAQMEGGKRPALARVEGYDTAIERLAAIEGRIAAKEEEIAELNRSGEAAPEA